MNKTTRLQELFHRGKTFVIAGGGCALHAKMVEATGFECAYMSGALTSAHVLGLPDAGVITMTEMVQNAGRMANAITIPLISDSDQGFGNAINVRRTVQAFIQAGVSGIHIEDQPFPKRCGFVKGKEIIPLEEAVGKYRAAVDAKRELDPDFVIIARCDARTAVGGGFEEALTRLKAYKKAGVDVVYFEAPQSLEEVKIARRELEGPMIATLIAINPQPTLAEMQKMGLAAAFYPGLAAFPGIIASWDFLQDFQKRGVQAEREFIERTKSHPLGGLRLFDLVGFPQVREWEEKYLPQEQLAKYEKSIGLYDPTDKAKLAR
ncbi:MAG: isocitrate lyase/PEP mutase family protein [Chloroflexi bacterium]|nr:isocitrate lyase/PEP mutase family protein [Chloroflexota bacterium]